MAQSVTPFVSILQGQLSAVISSDSVRHKIISRGEYRFARKNFVDAGLHPKLAGHEFAFSAHSGFCRAALHARSQLAQTVAQSDHDSVGSP